MLISYCSFLVLCIALSADTFAAGLSYSASKVRVPINSMCILSLVSGFTFTLSLSVGEKLTAWIPPNASTLLSFLILLILSLYKLYDALPERFHPSISFTTVSFSSHVNKKEPEYISPYEAAALSFVLSIDSITAGVSQGNSPLSPAVVFLFSSVIHFLSILLGTFAGRRLSGKLSCNLSFLPALLLFLLAISRLF